MSPATCFDRLSGIIHFLIRRRSTTKSFGKQQPAFQVVSRFRISALIPWRTFTRIRWFHRRRARNSLYTDTPSYVAEYLVSRLPIEDIDPDQLSVCDPMCGHGTFLVAALRRLRTLLPGDSSPEARHDFFVDHISGRDIDPFSVEVARLTLTLADLPNPDGWDIKQADAYLDRALEAVAERTTVFLTNPP